MTSTHPYWLMGLMILLGLLPVLIMCCTCYLKVSIVINLLKSGLGLTSGGTMAIELALSLALVSLIMHPVVSESAKNAELIELPELRRAPRLADLQVLVPVLRPWRVFLERHAGNRELGAVYQLITSPEAGAPALQVQHREELPIRVLFAAFVLSELQGALAMGVMVLIPFLLVDLVIANTLAALGLTMVSPVTISLPCKLLLFYAAEGWILISRSILLSY